VGINCGPAGCYLILIQRHTIPGWHDTTTKWFFFQYNFFCHFAVMHQRHTIPGWHNTTTKWLLFFLNIIFLPLFGHASVAQEESPHIQYQLLPMLILCILNVTQLNQWCSFYK
jgi:DMSO reductase anchor subunit